MDDIQVVYETDEYGTKDLIRAIQFLDGSVVFILSNGRVDIELTLDAKEFELFGSELYGMAFYAGGVDDEDEDKVRPDWETIETERRLTVKGTRLDIVDSDFEDDKWKWALVFKDEDWYVDCFSTQEDAAQYAIDLGYEWEEDASCLVLR